MINLALRKPNILHIVSDDQSYRTITDEAMPYLASRPGGNWVTFDRALLTTPLCHPARASLLTGRRSDHHGRTTNNSAPPPFSESDTAAPWMKAAGYHTGMIGKYLNGYPWTGAAYLPPGWDYWRATGGDAGTYYGWTIYDENLGALTGSDYLPDRFSSWVTDFITAAPTTKPWFCYYAPISPHNPWDVATRHQNLPIAEETPANFNLADLSTFPAYMRDLPTLSSAEQASAQGHRVDTKRMMRAVDEGLQNIFAAITARGDWDNTIIVFHTDNGYPYGEHRRHTGMANLPKGVPYRWCVDPQLRIRYPGATQRTESRLVTTCDLTATWIGAGQATPTIGMDGVSLERILCQQPITWREQVEAYYVGSAGISRWWATLRADGKKMVRYPTTGEKELFDWATDPDELVSVHASNTALVTSMDTALTALIDNPLHWYTAGSAVPEYAAGGGGVVPPLPGGAGVPRTSVTSRGPGGTVSRSYAPRP